MDDARANGSSIMKSKDRARMFPPRRVYGELVDRAVAAWGEVGDRLEVAGQTADRLASLVDSARKSMEQELATTLLLKERRHARIRADHRAYQALLLVRRVAVATGKADPMVEAAFRFLAEAFGRKSNRGVPVPPAPAGSPDKPAAA